MPAADVLEVWDKIAAATMGQRLGISAKVSARSSYTAPGRHIVCVYTRDFEDGADVERVLVGLRKLGFTSRLSYKTDAATLGGRYGDGAAVYVSQPHSSTFRVTAAAQPQLPGLNLPDPPT